MNKIISISTLFFIFLTMACPAQKENSSNAETNTNFNSAAKTPPTETPITEKTDDELQKQIAQIASAAKGQVGAKAILLETGETFSLDASGRFPMQSVYKLPIAMAVLRQVEAGKLTLEQKIKVEKSDFVNPGQRSPIRDENPNGAEISLKELIHYAVSESDGTASDVLLKHAGGAAGAMNYLNEIKVSDIVIANTEKEFGVSQALQYKNYATPDAAINMLRALYEKRDLLSEPNHQILYDFLINSPTGPNRLRGLLPKDAIVAHKTGTSGTFGGKTAATNDIGIVALPNGKHFAVAVFVSDSTADEKTREAVIAQIAKAAWDKWSSGEK